MPEGAHDSLGPRCISSLKSSEKGYTVQSTSESKATSLQELRLYQPENPYLALGHAVVQLMNMPAFASLRFGHWSQTLVGQINRKHYYFVLDNKNKVQGFLGWAVTTKDTAEAWLEGRGGLSERGIDGDCFVLNVWAASTPKVNNFIYREARKIFDASGKEALYFKRYYKDGSMRPGRMRNRFKMEVPGG